MKVQVWEREQLIHRIKKPFEVNPVNRETEMCRGEYLPFAASGMDK